ncbi:MAG: hypothetical protein ACK4S4_03460 [Pyrinomonadaceae bacterium]
MNSIVRNVLAVVAGLVIGGALNMSLVIIGPHVIALPPGVDVSTDENLIRTIHLFEPKNFIFPFLAHASQSFVGAFIAALIAATHRMKFALAIGVLSLLGGIAAVALIPAPLWYDVVDLVLAYIPMSWLGGMLAMRLRPGLS